MKTKIFSTNLWMVLIVFLVGVLNIAFAEKITIGNGFGLDGNFYGTWAKDFFNEIFVKEKNQYLLQRILPSAIVHYSLGIFHLPLENQHVIRGFEILNLVLLVIASYVWGLIADELKLTLRSKWLGFCGLFVNFAILKNNFYYPVATETTAFTLGVLSLYFYLRNHSLGLLITVLLGGFCWPTSAFFGFLLFLFPKDMRMKVVSGFQSRLSLMVPIMTSLIVLGGIILVHFIKRYHTVQSPVSSVLNLSIALVVSYVFFAFYYLFRNTLLWDPDILRTIKIKRLALVLLIGILLRLVIRYFSDGETGWRVGYFFERTIAVSIQKPLIHGIIHVVYYGPIVLITFFLWKLFCQMIHRYGMGLVLVIAFGISMSIAPESRQLINLFPFFVTFTIKVIDSLNWKTTHYWFIALLSLLYSKVWLAMNASGFIVGAKATWLTFPDQYFFMNFGTTLSNSMYIAQGSIVLFTAFLLYFVLFFHPTHA